MPAQNSSIDHSVTNNIVCPWCGYKYRDSWEYSKDSMELTCRDCDEPFTMERNVSVTYSTYRPVEKCPHEDLYRFDGGDGFEYESCEDCASCERLPKVSKEFS